jgi:CBS domain-containing protein
LRKWTDSPDIALFSYWLARVNLVLGVFNLMPAIPLDGGRAFRSLLASKKGMEQATVASVGVAKFLAWIFGFVGMIGLNFMLILIAFFIYTAADRELLMLRSRKLLKGLRVDDVGHRVIGVSEDDTVEFVAEEMIETQCRTLPVRTRTGKPGIITSEDLKQIPKGQWHFKRVSEVLTVVNRVFNVNESLDQIYPELLVSSVGLMEESGKIVGVIRAQDLNESLEYQSIATQESSPDVKNEDKNDVKPAA